MVDRWGRDPSPAVAHELGVVHGEKRIQIDDWYFAAHFHQDPVMPGSLGLQALEQILKAEAGRIWPEVGAWVMREGLEHRWTYRGQVTPQASATQYALHLKSIDHEHRRLAGEGWLACDGLPIYHVDDLCLRPWPHS